MVEFEVLKYQQILCKEIPDFLLKYINTKEMLRLDNIGQFCGADYCGLKLYNGIRFFYSKLDHSISVALIVWNFTKCVEATLAALFHDIATPVFSHAIDYMNGDTILQITTEEKTEEVIRNSAEITTLLKKDGIDIESVIDYKQYTIADNERPKLSADRLEGLLSACFIWLNIWNLKDIKKIYDNIKICVNKDYEFELCFKNKRVAKKFIKGMLALSNVLQSKEDKFALSFLGEIVRYAIYSNLLTYEDLFKITEKDIISCIKYKGDEYLNTMWDFFKNNIHVHTSNEYVEGKYNICFECKRCNIDPLIITTKKIKRASEIIRLYRLKEYRLAPDNDNKLYAYVDFNNK